MRHLWARQPPGEALVNSQGQPLRVVFPGWANGLGGPDFRRAILVTPQGEVRGDVEVHCRSSQWQTHGHHRDPAYNGVILQVVLELDSPAPARRQDGVGIPTLVLPPPLPWPEAMRATTPEMDMPCHRAEGSRGREDPEPRIGQLGKERFLSRGRRLQAQMGQGEAGQVLYAGLLEALGYSRNREPCRRLAQAWPLREVEALLQGEGGEAARHRVEAGLLGCAGLLPGGGREWAGLGLRPVLRETDWQFHGVRPSNHPRRRLAALAHLLQRYSRPGLLLGLLGSVARAQRARELEAALVVPQPEHPALLGRGRAGEIAVDVLLPFAYAYGQLYGQPSLAQQAQKLYESYPPLAENWITRAMGELLWPGGRRATSARQQQGLIQLFQGWCGERDCDGCPLGKA